MKKAKMNMKKTVLKHIKEDSKDFKEQLSDDKKLKKKLMSKKGKC